MSWDVQAEGNQQANQALWLLAERWMALFANRARPYAVQQVDGSYRWVYEEVTPQLVLAHLRGELTLAFSSTDARRCSGWACLDVDVPGSLPQLVALCTVLAELGLPGLVEASRRGGHLWVLLDEPTPAVVLRHALAEAVSEASALDVEIPAHELYPDARGTGALGHAVRLPLGVHRKTGLRYPLVDGRGLPCAFATIVQAAAFVLGAPRVASGPLREHWQVFLANRTVRHKTGRTAGSGKRAPATAHGTGQAEARNGPASRVGARVGPQVGTRSAVIRWVDAHVSPLELAGELAPDAEMRRAGRGSIGWCPFHDDRAPDVTTGASGSASFYVVEDRRYGWSWRCLSTNCAQSVGPMRHSFRLLQELLGVSVASAIREAASRWPAAAVDGIDGIDGIDGMNGDRHAVQKNETDAADQGADESEAIADGEGTRRWPCQSSGQTKGGRGDRNNERDTGADRGDREAEGRAAGGG